MPDSILESISDGVFTVDADWRVTSFNRAAERITGIDRKEAIGRFCHEVFKSNMCESECPLRKTLKTGKAIIDKKGYCLSPTGKRIPISVSTAILYDKDGKAVGGAETFRDLREIEELKEKLQEKEETLSSRNPKMQHLIDMIPTIARSPATVLIEGETGTGKEVIARVIHRMSDREKGPFVAVNCGALPDTLLESELFGYKKGAFTGADKNKAGRFKLAENGTLFLDEIGDIPLALQVKLLRVLQEREYEPLGATTAEKTNARIICATNKDLKTLVERGLFRRDLYYRINVITLSLPPLRERKEDIPYFAERFLQKNNEESGKRIRGFTSQAFAAFSAYLWPGNIRELENVIARATVLCDSTHIDVSLLPEELTRSLRQNLEVPARGEQIPTDKQSEDLKSAKRSYERQLILDTLRRYGGNCSAAAHEMGVDKATLYRKIKAYGIDLDTLRKE